MSKPHILIIGAGIGGLATAVALAKRGMKVTVVEKNKTPGGRCHRIAKQGHVFDTGPTMYIFPQLYEDYFSYIGENIHDHIKLIRTDPTYKLNFADNTSLTITSDLKKIKQQLEKLQPGSFANFQSYINKAKDHYKLTVDHLITKELESPAVLANPKIVYSGLKTRGLENHYAYANRFFKNQYLTAAFTFQDSYLSLDPFNSPAVYSLFPYTELHHGNFLPEGGMYQVILALEKIAQAHGVDIRYGCPVTKINVSNNKAVGITLQDTSMLTGDLVVANADLSYIYQHLLPPSSYTRQLLQKKYSCSALVFHWGLNKTYPQLATHNLFFSPDYRQGFDQVINHSQPPREPHFYIQAPTRTDTSRAPKNEDTLSVMVPINHIYPDHRIKWDSYISHVREYVLRRLKRAGLGDLRSHIKFEASHQPQDWTERYNLTYGAIYGLHHNLTQLGFLRPKRQHATYKNLYFVGASTHPGSGLPTVLCSAKMTCQQIISSLHDPNR